MICSILLLIILTSCVSGTFVVNVTQTSYQAEENHHITLEWTFTTNPHTSYNSLFIFCELITDLRPSVLFHLHKGVEVPESQDEQFAGRVQWDKDVLREGQLRLHVSRLRTEDSGLYVCDVILNYRSNSGKCRLNVTAARDQPEPETPNTTSPPQPEIWGRIGLYCGLTAALLGFCFCRCLLRGQDFFSKFKGGLRKSYSSAGGSVDTSKRQLEFDFIRQRHRNYKSVC
ncbi:uncharacterized protein LOC114546022 [Perca flavescens]|uniref:uncharacterized protein LOC114546022 n=1 Tax=Perca flavescens TaxID=8167 RepID=UPI00106EC5B9|nr:uncharacterized protein LOC114546022 [Perca flavescens]XP_028420468.1 uncharacterized protein LOC114546022 [Perca flavescens]